MLTFTPLDGEVRVGLNGRHIGWFSKYPATKTWTFESTTMLTIEQLRQIVAYMESL